MIVTVWPKSGGYEAVEYKDCQCLPVNGNINLARHDCPECKGTGVVVFKDNMPCMNVCMSNWNAIVRHLLPEFTIGPEDYCGTIPVENLSRMYARLCLLPERYHDAMKEIILCGIYNSSDLVWG